MITNEKYLLYILGVNKGQLDYLLAHILSLIHISEPTRH